MALTMEGEKEVLGLWIEQTRAPNSGQVINELKNRGVQDVSLPWSMGSRVSRGDRDRVPRTIVQICMVL